MSPFKFALARDVRHETYIWLCWSFDSLNLAWSMLVDIAFFFFHVILAISSTLYFHNSDANLFGIFHHKIWDWPLFLIILWYRTLLDHHSNFL